MYHGKFGFDEFSHQRAIVRKPVTYSCCSVDPACHAEKLCDSAQIGKLKVQRTSTYYRKMGEAIPFLTLFAHHFCFFMSSQPCAAC